MPRNHIKCSQPTHRGKALLFLALLIVVVILPGSGAAAAPQTVWRIGKFDHSSAEFNQGVPSRALSGSMPTPAPVVYVVGKSNPETDWPASQPASSND